MIAELYGVSVSAINQHTDRLIKDKNILKIKSDISSINQITNTVNLLENNDLLKEIKRLYR